MPAGVKTAFSVILAIQSPIFDTLDAINNVLDEANGVQDREKFLLPRNQLATGLASASNRLAGQKGLRKASVKS